MFLKRIKKEGKAFPSLQPANCLTLPLLWAQAPPATLDYIINQIPHLVQLYYKHQFDFQHLFY